MFGFCFPQDLFLADWRRFASQILAEEKISEKYFFCFSQMDADFIRR